MVRSHLDYCSSVWAPYRKSDIAAIEKVHKRATKILPVLKKYLYTERLQVCKLKTLTTRRYDRNLDNTWKYNPLIAPTINKGCSCLTRGNDKRLTNHL